MCDFLTPNSDISCVRWLVFIKEYCHTCLHKWSNDDRPAYFRSNKLYRVIAFHDLASMRYRNSMEIILANGGILLHSDTVVTTVPVDTQTMSSSFFPSVLFACLIFSVYPEVSGSRFPSFRYCCSAPLGPPPIIILIIITVTHNSSSSSTDHDEMSSTGSR